MASRTAPSDFCLLVFMSLCNPAILAPWMWAGLLVLRSDSIKQCDRMSLLRLNYKKAIAYILGILHSFLNHLPCKWLAAMLWNRTVEMPAQQGAEACRQPREWAWQPFVIPHLPTWAFKWDCSLVNNLTATSWNTFSQRHLAKLHSDFSPKKLWGDKCLF